MTGRSPEIEAIDPCTEVGVIVPRLSIELHAPRAGHLRGGGFEFHAEGELVYEVVAGDDLAILEVQKAELEEAKATRERHFVEKLARARDLRRAERLGEFLAEGERDAARDAHVISIRELNRADAASRAASARLKAQRALIRAGQIEAPFEGRVVQEFAIAGAWVETGEVLARFVSTDELVLRVGLPAEYQLPSSTEIHWYWPDRVGTSSTASLHPRRAEVDELSGLRLYEARILTSALEDHALGGSVRVEFPTCHGMPIPRDSDHDHP